jgi:hypothetical protein
VATTGARVLAPDAPADADRSPVATGDRVPGPDGAADAEVAPATSTAAVRVTIPSQLRARDVVERDIVDSVHTVHRSPGCVYSLRTIAGVPD